MDVEGSRSAQGIQMQGCQQPPEGVQGNQQQPGGALPPPLVQYTTINMVTEPPGDHIIWSLCFFVCYNICCLGLAALFFSIKARDRKMLGDLQGAKHYGSIARSINITSTVLYCLIVVTLVIICGSVFNKLQDIIKIIQHHNGY